MGFMFKYNFLLFSFSFKVESKFMSQICSQLAANTHCRLEHKKLSDKDCRSCQIEWLTISGLYFQAG